MLAGNDVNSWCCNTHRILQVCGLAHLLPLAHEWLFLVGFATSRNVSVSLGLPVPPSVVVQEWFSELWPAATCLQFPLPLQGATGCSLAVIRVLRMDRK